MGDTKEHTDLLNYPIILGEYARFMETVYGHSEMLCTYSGYQFNDFSKYDLMEGTKEFRDKYRDEQFPKDLKAAYELGKRLVEKAQSV